MSWGFFLDLSLALPAAEWKRIAATRVGDHALPPRFFGFKEKALEEIFVDEGSDEFSIARLPGLLASMEAHWSARKVGATTTIRALAAFDRSDPSKAVKAIAALFYAATATGEGHIVFVNAGTYSGEDGVLLRLGDGAITRSRLADCNVLVDLLCPALFEGADLPPPEEIVALAAGGRKRPKKAAPTRK